MFQLERHVGQTEPPRSPRETLPTMYELPSENPEEPGLPDEFHALQPQLLSRTCQSPQVSPQQMFAGTDLNLYYDVRHVRWYKRPDWFLAIGVPRLYDETDLRLSYVIWQEGIAPLVVVELLSLGTEAEDLGDKVRSEDLIQPTLSEEPEVEEDNQPELRLAETPKEKPPRKWEVYERLLRVPYYVTFSRYTDRLRVFTLSGDRYQEVEFDPERPQLWIPALQLGLGLWQGEFAGVTRQWLRWYDAAGNWILTDTEAAIAHSERLAARLRALGEDPDTM
jgi:Uma2 family endonuclease